MAVATYRELIAWQRAIELVEAVYRATAQFPRDEVYGLVSQARRAAVSIASNIAEGQGRGEGADFLRFLRVARGSTQEVETQMIIAERLGYLQNDELEVLLSLSAEASRLISGLARSVQPPGLATRNS